ncbi:MAG: SIMPL domain-containing protein [Candidatus Aquilonibacter sp.]
MNKTAILVAALLLLPVAAMAQFAPGPRGPGAQGTVNAPATTHGITVTGSAGARIPATSARITLTISSADRSLSLDAQSLQPVVDALVKSGADPASVQLPPNFSAPGKSNIASITATVAHPTAAMMQSGIVTVGTSVASSKNLVLNGAMVMVIAQHCADALDNIRSQAIERARAKAESIAKDLGVHVGSVLNVQSFEQGSPDGSCQSQYNVNGFMGSPDQPQSSQEYVTVPIQSNITITYAIK